jgi:hypothetical protein
MVALVINYLVLSEISISALVVHTPFTSRQTRLSYRGASLISIFGGNVYLSAITLFYATKSAH